MARLMLTTAAILAALCQAALAEPPPTPATPCFEVIPSTAGANAAPFGTILLDRCKGLTWLLIKDFPADANEGASSSYHWRWSPLTINHQEGTFSDPFGPPR
jgi:hypothetical protein